MANLSAGSIFAIRMDQIDVANLWDGTITEETGSKLTVDIGGGYVEHFTGFGVTYSALTGDPLSGTITGYEETLFGQPTFTVTGLNVSAVDFNTWVNNDDTFAALAHMFAGDDNMAGGNSTDFIAGLDGHDVITGGAAGDSLFGNAGNDHLYGQSASGGFDGPDSISGGDGMDYLQGNAGNDTLDGGNQSDRINGGADNDLIFGGAGNDAINGNLGNDTIDAGSNNDSARGGKGDDLILGGDGNDTIQGDLGNDTIEGGHGADTLTGGDGADVFRFNRYATSDDDTLSNNRQVLIDTITDFTHGTDHIQLEYVPTTILTGVEDSVIDALGEGHVLMTQHGGTHEVAAMQFGADTYLISSGDGTSDAMDLVIRLIGVDASTITTSDFV